MTKQQIDWRSEFRELYGDDFDGGFRDKLEAFISQTLISHLSEVKEEIEGKKINQEMYTENQGIWNRALSEASSLLSEKISKIK